MKIKLGLITGALLAGSSMVAQAQFFPSPGELLLSTIDNGNYRPLRMLAKRYEIKARNTSSDPERLWLTIVQDTVLSYIPIRIMKPLLVDSGVSANNIASRNNITATNLVSARYFTADSARATKLIGVLYSDSIITGKISNAHLSITGNTGIGMPADLSGAATNTPDADIDRLAVRGSLIAYLGATDAAPGTSYKMLKLHNAQSGTKDSWHIGFSANTNTNGTGYQELVQLRTKKSASGPVFSIAADNAGVMTDRFKIMQNGNVAIGLDTAVEKLAVNGKVKATGFVTDASSFPDYVFAPSYKLRSIDALAGYVQEHQKLPGMPSEKEVLSKGLNLAEVSVSTVEKVEELSLYIIQLNERIKQLEAKLAVAGK